MRYLAVSFATIFALTAGAAACYRPHPADEQSCTVRCGPGGLCPGAMRCIDGMCLGPDVSSCDGVDAGLPGTDAGGGSSDAGQAVCTGSPDLHYGSDGRMLHLTLTTPPTGSLTIATDIDTDTETDCLPVGPLPSPPVQTCILAAQTITISGTVHVTGSKALVLVADDTLTIPQDAELDLRGNRESGEDATTGQAAGASPIATCTTPSAVDGDPAGGGPGGSFISKGGDGGGTGSDAATPLAPMFQGGCNGTDGGQDADHDGGKGGGGGGAVYLFAGCSIEIDGKVNASGAGGGGGADGDPGDVGPQGDPTEHGGGGGGGGAGGFIGIDAPSVTVHGLLLADGGGGGEAGDPSHHGDGGETPSTAFAARGGSSGGPGGSAGGDGGNGPGLSFMLQSVDAGNGATGQNGESSGGGGGGEGAIYIYATMTDLNQAMIRPIAKP